MEPTRDMTVQYYHDPTQYTSIPTSWRFVSQIITHVANGPQAMVKFMFEGSFYGQAHGGLRLVDINPDTDKIHQIWGAHDVYGFDWMAVNTNKWEKRRLMRVLQLVKGRTYNFRLQARSQAGTNFR